MFCEANGPLQYTHLHNCRWCSNGTTVGSSNAMGKWSAWSVILELGDAGERRDVATGGGLHGWLLLRPPTMWTHYGNINVGLPAHSWQPHDPRISKVSQLILVGPRPGLLVPPHWGPQPTNHLRAVSHHCSRDWVSSLRAMPLLCLKQLLPGQRVSEDTDTNTAVCVLFPLCPWMARATLHPRWKSQLDLLRLWLLTLQQQCLWPKHNTFSHEACTSRSSSSNHSHPPP